MDVVLDPGLFLAVGVRLLVPNRNNSAVPAISPAASAARGTSISVPMRMCGPRGTEATTVRLGARTASRSRAVPW